MCTVWAVSIGRWPIAAACFAVVHSVTLRFLVCVSVAVTFQVSVNLLNASANWIGVAGSEVESARLFASHDRVAVVDRFGLRPPIGIAIQHSGVLLLGISIDVAGVLFVLSWAPIVVAMRLISAVQGSLQFSCA